MYSLNEMLIECGPVDIRHQCVWVQMGDHAEAVEPFPEESLANRGDPILTDFLRIEAKPKTNKNLPRRQC